MTVAGRTAHTHTHTHTHVQGVKRGGQYKRVNWGGRASALKLTPIDAEMK